MQKIKEDNEENSKQVSEEIDDEPEASVVQKEEDSQKDEVTAASCAANQTFICKCAMHWRSETGVGRGGKHVTLFPLIQAYEMTQNMFHQFQKQFNYSSGRKWCKKAVLNQRSN